MNDTFNWKRYWYPSNQIPNPSAGFFKVPTSQIEQLFAGDKTPYVTLEQLSSIPCVILLGEAGIGKTFTIQGLARQANDNDVAYYRFHDLRNNRFNERQDIEDEIFRDKIFQ